MSNPLPFSPAEVEVLREMLRHLLLMDDQTDGWSSKVEVRQSGFSLHVKFDRKCSVSETLQVAQAFDQAPIKLAQIVSRVLDQLDAS